MLIVNVASQCGYTPQYKELAALYDKYSNQGFVILGFPCNQVGQILSVLSSHLGTSLGMSVSVLLKLRCRSSLTILQRVSVL